MTELNCSPNLLLVMESLWFHQIVFFSEPISKPTDETFNTISQTSLDSSVSELLTITPPPEEQSSVSSDTSPNSPKVEGLEDDTEEDEEIIYNYKRKTPTSLLLVASKSRSHSSLPSSMHKLPKHLRNVGVDTSLKKTMSCKTLVELEYEEVKGFMDLGFRFKKELLSPRMISVVPGLQRLDEYKDGLADQLDVEIQEWNGKDNAIMRPYLSEAWLIRRPDSPLLNLKIPGVLPPTDMKKHLKCWARTVASSIQLEY
ncbi:Mlo-related protein [Thalictrum thalictroides]|uniref:Mlo-related protein n=1 Tax=Thalictrum thalictroides TaxID=46969 RepID=A0A7J6V784_THATH|nr:Mlo-related protein [Thalictrum thalictroides]